MKLIVAVYDDWGIGANGTQPIALHADRMFFRRVTKGATVIVGRRTVEDFPGQRPLPGRRNILISKSCTHAEGFEVCGSVEDVLELTRDCDNVFVIGGGSIYRQFLDDCTEAYVTKVHTSVSADIYFPNLDENPGWSMAEILETGEEAGIRYEMCRYIRK